MTRRSFAVLPMLLMMLAGCTGKAPETAPEKASEKAPGKPPVKRYPMQGEIKAVDASAHSATIAAGPIGDWMGAMTMEYPVKDPQEFGKLKVGANIQAKITVQGTDYWISSVSAEPAK